MISLQMMIAVVRAFAKKDDLTTPEQKKEFKIQFQLNENNMKQMESHFKKIQKEELTEMEKQTKFAKNYKISFEDLEEFGNEFKLIGQETLTKQLTKKSDTEFLELIKNFNQEKTKFSDSKLKSQIGRKVFMERYKLKKGEISKLEEYLTKFAEEAKQFDKSQSVIIVLMSHGRSGKILGIS